MSYMIIWTLVALCVAALLPDASASETKPGSQPPDPREFVKEIDRARTEYQIELGGTLDSFNTAYYKALGGANMIELPGFQPNVRLIIENVGEHNVVNPRLVINDEHDWFSLDTLVAEVCKPRMTDREKAFALFEVFRDNFYHTNPPRLTVERGRMTSDAYDPIQHLNCNNGTACSPMAICMVSAWRHAGLKGRVINFGVDHWISEVFYDGGWHMFDADMKVFHLRRDNKTVASIDDCRADPGLIGRSHHFGFAAPDNGGYGPFTMPNSASPCEAPTSHTMAIVLRPGESLVRCWPEASRSKYATGQLVYRPDLSKPNALAGALRSSNVATFAADGKRPYLHTKQAPYYCELVFPVRSPYPTTGGRIEVQFESKDGGGFYPTVFVSFKDDRNWLALWTGLSNQPSKCDVSIDSFIDTQRRRGVYEYFVKIEWLPYHGQALMGIDSLIIKTDLAVSGQSLPALRLGRNKVVYRDDTTGDRKVRVTHQWRESSANRPPESPEAAKSPADQGHVSSLAPTLQWKPATDSDGEAIQDYRVELRDRPDMRFTLSPSLERITFSDKPEWKVPEGFLNPGQRYYWRVQARDKRGAWSPWSNVWSFTAGEPRTRAATTSRKVTWRTSAQVPPAVAHAANPSEPVVFAASELRRYLGRILGVTVPEATGQKGGPIISLAISKDLNLTDEGYEFSARGNVFRITGGGDLGLVFGTYEFLRRFGGCRFSDLGPDGEYVPRRQKIEAEAGPLQMKPKLWYRGLQFFWFEDPEKTVQRIDWMAKNGLNYLSYTPFPDESKAASVVSIDAKTGKVVIHPANPNLLSLVYHKAVFDKLFLPAVRLRGLKLDMNHHNLYYWLPRERYFRDHPDWFQLIDGERRLTDQLGICTTNQEAVSVLTENVRRYLRENPEVKVVGVIQEDGYGMCQCPKCVAADNDPSEAFKKDHTGENRSKSNRYARMLNAVASAVHSEFPDVLVGGAAYVDMVYPPRDVQLDTNTMMWVAMYWRDGCRPIAPENTSTLNKTFWDLLKQWKEVYRGRLIVYEYYMGMSCHVSMPYPMSEVICEDWKNLKRLGIEGATVQCWSSNHSTYALNLLAFARCGWYDEVDHDEVLNDYLLGAYGSVANDLRPIFEGMIQGMRKLARGKNNLLPSGDSSGYFLDSIGRDTIRRALQSAGRNAQSDGERHQVERLSAAVRYWEMVADLYGAQAKATELEKSDQAAALKILDQAVNQQWPQLHQYLTTMPLGWLEVTVDRKPYWAVVDKMRDAATKLRKLAPSTGEK